MSDCLSVTVITSIETRLNAATAMISVRMMNIMRFSICTAANQLRFSADQSRTSVSPPAARQVGRRSPAPTSCRVVFSRTPLTPSTRNSVRRRRCSSAPGSNCRIRSVRNRRCDHGQLAQARHHAGRRGSALRRDQGELRSPRSIRSWSRQLAPIARRTRPGAESASIAGRRPGGSRRPRGSSAGSMPRTRRRARICSGSASPGRRRRARRPITCGWRRACVEHSPASPSSAAPGEHLDVREHRQHPVAHFLLESVHHRQHDDQRGDAQRDTRPPRARR